MSRPYRISQITAITIIQQQQMIIFDNTAGGGSVVGVQLALRRRPTDRQFILLLGGKQLGHGCIGEF